MRSHVFINNTIYKLRKIYHDKKNHNIVNCCSLKTYTSIPKKTQEYSGLNQLSLALTPVT